MPRHLIITTFTFLFVPFFFACEETTCIEVVDVSSVPLGNELTEKDFLKTSLRNSLALDSSDCFETKPFKAFESGFLLNDSVQNAIYVEQLDSTCNIHLYELKMNEWVLVFQKFDLAFNSLYFDLNYIDFNFDGTKDLFMRMTCSNGYAISRGHLFEYDPIEKELILHTEVEHLGNFSADNDNKYLVAEDSEECKVGFKRSPVQIQFKLINGTLTEVGRISECD
ncbi:MAG: hypothetical protein GQ574_24985 [Crocinitomix sp.]|nr:hypothetical protein [Crocinitomix sp.]